MSAEGDIKTEAPEHFEWNVENEIHLFEAMIGYKPVGKGYCLYAINTAEIRPWNVFLPFNICYQLEILE